MRDRADGQQRVRHRAGLPKVLRPAEQSGHRMILRQRLEQGAEIAKLRGVCADAEHAAILLQHIDAGPAVAAYTMSCSAPLGLRTLRSARNPRSGSGR